MSVEWTDLRIPVSPCPYCSSPNDCVTNPKGSNGPRQGDLSICLRCGGLVIFGDDLAQRAPTDPELFEVMMGEHWPEIRRAQEAVYLMHREMGKPGGERTASDA